MDKRIPWAEYFMNIAYLVAERSTCLRRRVGALAVKEDYISVCASDLLPAEPDFSLFRFALKLCVCVFSEVF